MSDIHETHLIDNSDKFKTAWWEHLMNFSGIIIIFTLLYYVHKILLPIGIIIYIFGIRKYLKDKKMVEESKRINYDEKSVQN